MDETQRLIELAWDQAYRLVAGPDNHGQPVDANVVWEQLADDLRAVGLRLDLRLIGSPERVR